MRRILSLSSLSALALAALLVLSPLAGAKAEDEGLFAEIHTGKGIITARLHYRLAPLTVMNFIRLAEGTAEWTHPETGEKKKEPLYRNLTFHQVKDFMVQTGDPAGKGKGGPGYVFDDEFHPKLTHASAGVLSMANRGPNTNGSQFFITKVPAKWLDRRHTVFGQVVSKLDIVEKIVQGDTLQKIVILRKGQDAQAFNAQRAHEIVTEKMAALRQAAKKTVPEAAAPVDPATVPAKDQPAVSPGNFQFIVIGHTEMKNLSKLKRVFFYDHAGAIKIAAKIVRLARAKGADFPALIKKYTDMGHNTSAKGVKDSPLAPAGLKQIYRLKPGQISDPVDLSSGVYVFKRLADK